MTPLTQADPHFLIIGPGYTARHILAFLSSQNITVSVAARRPEVRKSFAHRTQAACALDPSVDDWPSDITHLVISVPPPRQGNDDLPDAILRAFKSRIEQLSHLRWIGYLSSTNVYGDQNGGWVTEKTRPTPGLERGHRRLAAEKGWTDLAGKMGITSQIFRLAGIYGPGRNALESVKSGTAKRVIKPGQVFSRIHVEDIAHIVAKAATSAIPSGIFNLADDLPSPPQDVIEYAAHLLHREPPPEIAFDQADLSPMAKSFYTESKKVKASRIKEQGISLLYPTYKLGLKALMKDLY